MSARIARVHPQVNNTSGVPGLRLNRRKGYRVIDVTWNDETGRRHCTSYLLGDRPVIAVERAILRRQEETNCTYPITARQAWNRMRTRAGFDALMQFSVAAGPGFIR